MLRGSRCSGGGREGGGCGFGIDPKDKGGRKSRGCAVVLAVRVMHGDGRLCVPRSLRTALARQIEGRLFGMGMLHRELRRIWNDTSAHRGALARAFFIIFSPCIHGLGWAGLGLGFGNITDRRFSVGRLGNFEYVNNTTLFSCFRSRHIDNSSIDGCIRTAAAGGSQRLCTPLLSPPPPPSPSLHSASTNNQPSHSSLPSLPSVPPSPPLHPSLHRPCTVRASAPPASAVSPKSDPSCTALCSASPSAASAAQTSPQTSSRSLALAAAAAVASPETHRARNEHETHRNTSR